ncbi:hypothetical protein ACW9H7_31345, partial [Pseudomonas yamanorum]
LQQNFFGCLIGNGDARRLKVIGSLIELGPAGPDEGFGTRGFGCSFVPVKHDEVIMLLNHVLHFLDRTF